MRLLKIAVYFKGVIPIAMIKMNYRSDLDINEKVMMGIVKTSELFKKDSLAIFKKYGLTFPQYNVLRVLQASQGEHNTMGNVSKIMLVSGGNITGIAKRLEMNGFITRKRATEDDRVIVLKLLSKGKETLNKIAEEKDENLEKYFKYYSEKQKLELLNRIKAILNS